MKDDDLSAVTFSFSVELRKTQSW